MADDRVHGVRLADDLTTEWTEVEVELVDGRPRDLDAVEKVLERAGFGRSRWPSKVESMSRNCHTGAVRLVMMPYSPPWTWMSLA